MFMMVLFGKGAGQESAAPDDRAARAYPGGGALTTAVLCEIASFPVCRWPKVGKNRVSGG
ncbi:MAG: hypothetical protein J0I47_09590 [Sphingomonas sp.]|uniref:hypothetical protein n=1 Tax=Sphingomonas sp. TaxID=28214 RepID=UPI001AD3245B|nr:hypothetical protein [Sphingomonas sp.]MBN8808465.1 hypothetical protein [Sphingomonas sp.]